MDDALYFSEQHLAVREMVRQFARDEVAPVASKFDADSTFPWENVKKMGELGLLGVPWAEELGGAGLDLLSYMITIQELAKVDASTGLTVSAHTTLGTSPIVHFGTADQKQRYVPLLASGRVLADSGSRSPTPAPTQGAPDTAELIMEDVEVPEENRLGEEGQGFGNFMRTLDSGRIGIAALSLGIAEGAYEEAVKYASVRRQFGKPIAEFQGISFQLADMANEIEAGKHLMV